MTDEVVPQGDSGGGTTSAVLDSPSQESTDLDPTSSDPDGGTSVAGDDEGGPGSDAPQQPVLRFTQKQFDERLKGERQKYERLKWAEAHRREDVEQRANLANWIDRDPVGFVSYMQRMMQAQGYQLPQTVAPTNLAAQQPNANTLPGPDYQYRDEQGNLAKFYSADRMGQVVQYLEQRFGQRIGPLEQYLGSMQVQQRAQADATRILGEAESWPHFGDFRQEIHDAMASDRNLTLERAYIQVVLPELGNRERQAVVQDLQQKPAATTTSPTRSQPQGTEDLSKLSLQQLFKREMKRRGMGA